MSYESIMDRLERVGERYTQMMARTRRLGDSARLFSSMMRRIYNICVDAYRYYKRGRLSADEAGNIIEQAMYYMVQGKSIMEVNVQYAYDEYKDKITDILLELE